MSPADEPLSRLLLPTLVSFLNGSALCLLYGFLPRLRQNSAVQGVTWIYLFLSLALYSLEIPPTGPVGLNVTHWLYLVAVVAYIPIFTYLCASLVEGVIEALFFRTSPDHAGLRMEYLRNRIRRRGWRSRRWSARSLNRLLERKLRDLRRNPTDPTTRRELVELYLGRDEIEAAVYHAYALVEMLPHGHAHAFALYRLGQILVDRLDQLEGAQPYLRRIIRSYPRSFFASYARRLVNQYEAYADRDL